MKKLDVQRRKNEKLTDLEESARKAAKCLIQKAMEERQNQEEEIKVLDSLINNAKIQAIRDAQILEKEQIKKEMLDEERRLDDMMEMERINKGRIQDSIDSRRREMELQGASAVLKQISENEEERLINCEKIEQENSLFRKEMSELLEAEIIKRDTKKLKQQKLREELDLANRLIIEKRQRDKDFEKQLDEKILRIQKEKADREAAFEAEQARIKYEKELEVARIRGQQERLHDEAAERDELRARRAAEANEREWRKKELEMARKKAETEAQLRESRDRQAENKKRLMAVQARQEQIEFERILKMQKELIEKDKQEAEKLKHSNKRYAMEIRRQICQKEQERIAQRNNFFEEGIRMQEEAHLRRARLLEAKQRKMDELKDAGIPEKYLAQVERKIKECS